MERKHLLGDEVRKIDPRLRVYADCAIEINAVRAELCANLRVQKDHPEIDEVPHVFSELNLLTQTASPPKPSRPSSLERVEQGAEVAVFIHTSSASTDAPTREKLATDRLPEGVTVRDKVPRGNLVVGSVGLHQLETLVNHSEVTYIEAGQTLTVPKPLISVSKFGDGTVPKRSVTKASDKHYWGKNVLIGIIDVEGFDYAHEDFLDSDGKTRFESIWDQGGEALQDPDANSALEFKYGNEISQVSMNQAIEDAKVAMVPAYLLEPQSQMVIGSHGTHVASIAAGNHGVCKKANIVGVLLALPKSDVKSSDETGIVRSDCEKERRFSFYDSTRIAHAVEYILKVAEKLGTKDAPMPVTINISLGTNGHAHDGSVAISRWLDNALAVPGRAVCVAAGNAGQEAATFEGDTGYVMGRIHTSGTIPATNLLQDIEWIVVGNGVSDMSENEMEIWYGPHDRFAVQVKPPGSKDWWPRKGWIEPRQFLENEQLPNGTFLSIYNELFHPANGSNYISIYLSPFLSKKPEELIGIIPGKWTVRLKGLDVRDGRYHAWIERDDPRPFGRVGAQQFWRFPSFFSEHSNKDDTSVGSLACGQRVVSVANMDEATEMIAVTSSQGPTRDNRFKPDVAAPGTNIIAAKGFAGSDDAWVSMSGTSMAAPYVTGVAGLMLAIEPKLTAAQIEGIIKGTADPLPGTGYAWSNKAGFGRINAGKCVSEAVEVTERRDLSRRRAT